MNSNTNQGASSLFKLSSSVFSDGSNIPIKYTCQGENISPPLSISGVPSEAKSLAIILHDPDAPAGDFTHWLLWNVDPSTKDVPENSLPSGAVQGLSDFGANKYGGPCPPSGIHHYVFELFAINEKLDIPASSNQAALRKIINDHILDQTKLTGLFSK